MKKRNQLMSMGLFYTLWKHVSIKQFTIIIVMLISISLVIGATMIPTVLAGEGQHPRINIKVTNLDTGMPIKKKDTLFAVTPFQVTVINYEADCAGQFIVTALGDTNIGAPPSVIVQAQTFIIGPSVDSNSASGAPLMANFGPDGYNDWKITASCNGVEPFQRSFDSFEFFVSGSY